MNLKTFPVEFIKEEAKQLVEYFSAKDLDPDAAYVVMLQVMKAYEQTTGHNSCSNPNCLIHNEPTGEPQ